MDTQGSSSLGKKAWTASSKVIGDSVCSEQTYRNGVPKMTPNYSLQITPFLLLLSSIPTLISTKEYQCFPCWEDSALTGTGTRVNQIFRSENIV